MNSYLKSWELTDAAFLSKALSNRNVQNNLKDGINFPYTEADALAYITEMMCSASMDTFSFAITVDDIVIGSIGIFRKNNIYRLTAELGYYINEEYWNKGITTQAVKQICQFVFSNSDIIRIYAEPFAHNFASCRVLEKAGFTCDGVLRANAVKNGNILDTKIYSLIKDDV